MITKPLEKTVYTSSILSGSLGTIMTNLADNKELVFILIGLVGCLIGVFTFLLNVYLQIRDDKRKQELFESESILLDRRIGSCDNGMRRRKTDKKTD